MTPAAPTSSAFGAFPSSLKDAPIDARCLDAQAALMPQALGVFAVCLPIFVWSGSYARDAAWMAASFAIFAINWGAFYFTVQWLRRPGGVDLARRTRIHVLSGLLWSGAVAQMAALADHAGPARDTLLMMTMGAAVICLVWAWWRFGPRRVKAEEHEADLLKQEAHVKELGAFRRRDGAEPPNQPPRRR